MPLYNRFGVPGFHFPGRSLDKDIEDSPLDMRYTRRKPVKSKNLLKDLSPEKFKKPKNTELFEAKAVPPAKGKSWQIFSEYEGKSYKRKGIVRFSYTSRKVFSKSENYSGKSTNAIFLRSVKNDEASLNAYMRKSNFQRVSYLARNEAAIEPTPYYMDSSDEAPLYTYSRETGNKINIYNSDAIALMGTDSTFNFVLSPEDENVDLCALARLFVQRVQKHIKNGKPSFWLAANHFNTENPHVHICMGKTDRVEGKELYLPKYYTTKKMREDLSDCLEILMGPRTWEEENVIRRKTANRRSYTPQDSYIMFHTSEDSQGNLLFPPEEFAKLAGDKSRKDELRRRLFYLKTRGFADYNTKNQTWVIRSDFDIELKKDYYMRLFGMDMDDESQRAKYIVHTNKKSEIPFTGQLIDYRRSDNSNNNIVLLIKDRNGKLHFHEDRIDENLYTIQKDKALEFERSEHGLRVKGVRN